MQVERECRCVGRAVDRVTSHNRGLRGNQQTTHRVARSDRGGIERAVRVGLALDCTIADVCSFDRKHYFYPDLPKGYQITQDQQPVCRAGVLRLNREGREFGVRINRIHIEEDAGKTVHDSLRGQSRVDYNRAGTPLIEIVTEPDLQSADDAVAYLKKLHESLDL